MTEPTAADLVAKLGEKAEKGDNYPGNQHESGETFREFSEAERATDAYAAQAVNFHGPLVAALEKDDKLAVHRRRCLNCGGLRPCKRALDLHADAEATRAEVLAAVAKAAKEALG